MTNFTSPWADYKACWPVSEVAPLLSWCVKAPCRTDLHLFQGCLLPAETEAGPCLPAAASAGRKASLHVGQVGTW